MHNGLNSVCLMCEGICCGEQIVAYNAMKQFMLNNSKRTKFYADDVVAGNIIN